MMALNIAIASESGSEEGREWLQQYMRQEVTDLVSRKAGVSADSVIIDRGFNPATEIALLWSIHDVLSVRADLTDAEARGVLQEAYRRHDASVGVTWQVLEEHARWSRREERTVVGDLLTAEHVLRARLRLSVPEVVLLDAEPAVADSTPAGWLKVSYGFNGRRHALLQVSAGGLVDEAQYHARRHLLIRIADGEA